MLHYTNRLQSNHRFSVYFAPRGSVRMVELGMQLSQQHLNPLDLLIGFIGDAGAGKSMLIKGMFPGLELTNDDEGVNIRPLPLLDMDHGSFCSPHTYHLDIRFESAFTQMHELAEAILSAIRCGKRVIVEHFDLIYPFLKTNAHVLIGVGEEVILTRPSLFGPEPKDIVEIVYRSIKYRKMVHTAEDLAEYFLDQAGHIGYEHSDVRHGFVLSFKEKPLVNIEKLEKKVRQVIAEDLPISYCDEEHIKIGDEKKYCTGPRNHVKSTGEIEKIAFLKEIVYDEIADHYLLVGMVGQEEINIGDDINKLSL